MDRMKTLLGYALLIIIFFIFSEVLINLNLETIYQNIGRKDNITQVTIYQAQATKISGRIKGKIDNEQITSKYIRIDLYSERDNLLGSKYIEVANLQENKEFKIYFKVQDVEYYEIKLVDNKEEKEELPEMVRDLTKGELICGTFLAFLIFW